MLKATGGTAVWLYSWPRGKVPMPRDPDSFFGGDSVYGLGPSSYALAFGLPPPASLPRYILPRGKRKRDGLFYGPLAWKPLTQKEIDRGIGDIFGSRTLRFPDSASACEK